MVSSFRVEKKELEAHCAKIKKLFTSTPAKEIPLNSNSTGNISFKIEDIADDSEPCKFNINLEDQSKKVQVVTWNRQVAKTLKDDLNSENDFRYVIIGLSSFFCFSIFLFSNS